MWSFRFYVWFLTSYSRPSKLLKCKSGPTTPLYKILLQILLWPITQNKIQSPFQVLIAHVTFPLAASPTLSSISTPAYHLLCHSGFTVAFEKARYVTSSETYCYTLCLEHFSSMYLFGSLDFIKFPEKFLLIKVSPCHHVSLPRFPFLFITIYFMLTYCLSLNINTVRTKASLCYSTCHVFSVSLPPCITTVHFPVDSPQKTDISNYLKACVLENVLNLSPTHPLNNNEGTVL